jgi:hypothetical protein
MLDRWQEVNAMYSSLLLLGGAALLLSCVMLPLRWRARTALFAVVIFSVLDATGGTTVTDNTIIVLAALS